MDRPIARILDLVDPLGQRLSNASVDEARLCLLEGDMAAVLALEGSFARRLSLQLPFWETRCVFANCCRT